jgi:AraC-like DNA-binding protein
MEQYNAVMTKLTTSTISHDRLRDLIAELGRYAPQWADRLSRAQTEHELLEVVCKLFDLSHALTPAHDSVLDQEDLARKIAQFISNNLHKGLTLKLLAQFLGYSEKYCSDLFRLTMGESFTRYLKRQRTDTAVTMLKHTDKPIADIASALGFSDQFSFSHFFKRATGLSPRDFRPTLVRPRRFRTSPPPIQGTR